MKIRKNDLDGKVLFRAYEVLYGKKASKKMSFSRIVIKIMARWNSSKFYRKRCEVIARKSLFLIAGMSLPKVSEKAAEMISEFDEQFIDVLPVEIMGRSAEAQEWIKYQNYRRK